jgi:hypothetical protein
MGAIMRIDNKLRQLFVGLCMSAWRSRSGRRRSKAYPQYSHSVQAAAIGLI